MALVNPSAVALVTLAAVAVGVVADPSPPRVLVFTRTEGFRHDSIPAGVAMYRRLGLAACFEVVHTEDQAWFTPENLNAVAAVVFLCTTGDVLDAPGQAALEAYLRDGGGWVGVHSASDTEYDWPFYGELIGGAYFANHPAVQQAVIHVEQVADGSTRHLPRPWVRRDEWYNFRRNPRADVQVLLRLDEASYSGGEMVDHPIAWKRVLMGGGRAWYTAGGHTLESYSEPLFEQHVLGGLLWAARLDCRADVNGVGGLTVQDVFDYLTSYFEGRPRADFNGDGALGVEDAFDYLRAYFAGCPT